MSPETPRRSSRYLMLDLWRGFAAMWVVLLHSSYFAHGDPTSTSAAARLGHVLIATVRSGWYGVPLFFVISGYCIAATCESHGRKQGRVVDFFQRRLRRIYPPYLAALVVMLIACELLRRLVPATAEAEQFMVPPAAALSPGNWIGNLTLTEQWLHHFIGGRPLLYVDPSWSLMYEEQFYLVCGLTLIVAGKRFLSGTAVVTLLVCAGLLATRGQWPAPVEGFFFDGRWLTFAMGIAVYAAVNTVGARGRAALVALLLGAIAWAVLLRRGAFGPLASHTQLVYATELLVGACFAVLLVLVHRFDEAWRWLPVLRPFAFLGRISYSLYIVHIGVTSYASYLLARAGLTTDWEVLLVVVPVCSALSVGAATLFFNLVERRFLNSPDALIPLRKPAPPA